MVAIISWCCALVVTFSALAKIHAGYSAEFALPENVYYAASVLELILGTWLITGYRRDGALLAVMLLMSGGMLVAAYYDGDCG